LSGNLFLSLYIFQELSSYGDFGFNWEICKFRLRTIISNKKIFVIFVWKHSKLKSKLPRFINIIRENFEASELWTKFQCLWVFLRPLNFRPNSQFKKSWIKKSPKVLLMKKKKSFFNDKRSFLQNFKKGKKKGQPQKIRGKKKRKTRATFTLITLRFFAQRA